MRRHRLRRSSDDCSYRPPDRRFASSSILRPENLECLVLGEAALSGKVVASMALSRSVRDAVFCLAFLPIDESPRLYRLLVIKRLRRGRAHAGIGSPILQLRCLARTVVWRDCSEIAELRKRCLAPDFAVAIRDLSSHRCDLQTNAEPQQFFAAFIVG